MWRSLHAAATYSGTTKNSYSKRNKEQFFGKQLFKKKTRSSCSENSFQIENKGQLLGKQFFKINIAKGTTDPGVDYFDQ